VAQIKLKPSKAYPSVPAIVGTTESHTRALQAIREGLEIGQRRTKNILDSYVRVKELVDLGIIQLDGDIITQSLTDQDTTIYQTFVAGSGVTLPIAISDVLGLTSSLSTLSSDIAINQADIAAIQAELVATYAVRIDEATSTVTYIGEAAPGTLSSAASWRIQRITFITPGEDDAEIEWADGDSDFNNVWNNRASLTYS
jgi:hypothetical protein